MMAYRVLVLGGYGFFGQRICAGLRRNPSIDVSIAGRDGGKAAALAAQLGIASDNAVVVDAHTPELAQVLKQRGIQLVINTAGPFQNQDYRIPRAAIEAGCNYVDLADSREFVVDIATLDAPARDAGVTVISGASSVPALSTAVLDRFGGEFDRLIDVRIGIGSGARTPGVATVRGIFSYCGNPFTRWVDGRWETTYGWMDLTRHRFPHPVGARLLGSCNVPDLALIPSRYPAVRTAMFHAGFASSVGHLLVWTLSALVKARVLRSVVPFANALNRISGWIEPFVSDKGAMFVRMSGTRADGTPLTKTWNVLATHNHGPSIPCGAAIALANKFAAGEALPKGAMPCVGLITLDEYLSSLRHLDVMEVIE
jgi:saccharopine dehydrogenase-like NADP-dependent oxidoreductase